VTRGRKTGGKKEGENKENEKHVIDEEPNT